jgi:threonine dehydratase
VLAALEPLAISARDVTEDEMAKTHARYLAGGRSSAPVEGERIIRFEFPEHSGALRSFLSNLKEDGVGLTMLHYRSHGGQVGKVLAGVSVPLGQEARFTAMLEGLGYTSRSRVFTLCDLGEVDLWRPGAFSNRYTFYDETANPVYTEYMK